MLTKSGGAVHGTEYFARKYGPSRFVQYAEFHEIERQLADSINFWEERGGLCMGLYV